jgi:hypothetical protein
MSTKIDSKPVVGGDTGRVSLSQGPATPKGPGFGAVLAGARPILKGAEAVATVLPGGPLLSAAVKAAPTVMSAPGGGLAPGAAVGGVPISPRLSSSPIASGSIGAGMGGGLTGGAPSAGLTGPAGAGEQGGVEGVLADSQAFNMYYLQLQEEISAENRQYSALSNVLKARHDTVKNAIGNIR